MVTVETRLPDGAVVLDPLQQVGTSTLLEHGFDAVEAIEGPDGIEIDVVETIVAVHPGGAILKVFVRAPSLEIAEHAVGSVAADVLERSELLADWVVESSEVKLHIDLTRESLEAADGPDAPPSDLQARRAQHAARSADAVRTAGDGSGARGEGGAAAGSGDGEGAGDGDEGGRGSGDGRTADHRAHIRGLAPRLSSFTPASFHGEEEPDERAHDAEGHDERAHDAEGHDEREHDEEAPGRGAEAVELAAGALVYASDVLIDELYDDVQTLADEATTVADCGSELWHLDALPPRYAGTYDELFARRFLVTAIALTTRFTDGSFQRLGCLAEELVLKLLVEQAHATLDLYGLLDHDTAEALDRFADGVYEDRDFEWLYDDSTEDADEDPAYEGPGVTPSTLGGWFTPFGDDRYVHPYAVDETAESDPGSTPSGHGAAGGGS
ncbi:hypothetical protein [Streptomyces venezuelae]|uniref:hypothetical protein n=1 Tax=Streptomyces venezuelae TaxID=54571 RepID=UPI001CCE9626|nr:hypothetical protein [Streptomyces venezuelae]